MTLAITPLDLSADAYLPLLMQQSVAALTGALSTRPLDFNQPGDHPAMHDDELDLLTKCLDDRATELAGDHDAAAWLEKLFELSVAELDARWAEWPEGVLESHLRAHLEHHQRRLGISLD